MKKFIRRSAEREFQKEEQPRQRLGAEPSTGEFGVKAACGRDAPWGRLECALVSGKSLAGRSRAGDIVSYCSRRASTGGPGGRGSPATAQRGPIGVPENPASVSGSAPGCLWFLHQNSLTSSKKPVSRLALSACRKGSDENGNFSLMCWPEAASQGDDPAGEAICLEADGDS